jgi:hypothetical protein
MWKKKICQKYKNKQKKKKLLKKNDQSQDEIPEAGLDAKDSTFFA